ncbi:PLP-dependent transferase [Antarctobacter sp.]|uniref:PLP-dependent transferase n=1 Tax=Antarctobacter sp. TaxID=1872577 RepID=UPI003A9318DB
MANLATSRFLVIHPARRPTVNSPEDQIKAGAGPNILRLSVGIEDVNDLIADLDQALS